MKSLLLSEIRRRHKTHRLEEPTDIFQLPLRCIRHISVPHRGSHKFWLRALKRSHERKLLGGQILLTGFRQVAAQEARLFFLSKLAANGVEIGKPVLKDAHPIQRKIQKTADVQHRRLFGRRKVIGTPK